MCAQCQGWVTACDIGSALRKDGVILGEVVIPVLGQVHSGVKTGWMARHRVVIRGATFCRQPVTVVLPKAQYWGQFV